MHQNMTRRIARLVGRSSRIGGRVSDSRLRPACDIVQMRLGEEGGPTARRFQQWVRAVPWRHVWILGLLVLLLVCALFGFFPRH
jgi:hypothetical protein